LAVAVRGATIVKAYEGAYTNLIVYRQRCDGCGYTPSGVPIIVTMLPYGTVAYGTYHAESFVCPFCGNRQKVKIQG